MTFAADLTRRSLALPCRLLCGIFLAAFGCRPVHSQSTVEAAGTNSQSSAATNTMKSPNVPLVPSSAAPVVSPHVLVASVPHPEEINRRSLAQNAGTDASKLLVRSTLPESSIWIDGKRVGKVPMLIIVPPGKYLIELVGPHAERTSCVVALLPRETRELTLKLLTRYPARVTMHSTLFQ